MSERRIEKLTFDYMMKILKLIKIDCRERIVRELYKYQTTSIKVKEKPQLQNE